MNITRLLIPGTLVLVVSSVAACQSETALPSPDNALGSCRPEAASALAGNERISDDHAMQLTGATVVRQIQPGDPVTMDFRAERVTIENEPTTGKIVRASCG